MGGDRGTRHDAVCTALAALDDGRLAALMATATPLGTGIGGTTWSLDVAGHRVFVKRVALTDVELRHVHSTADLYGLPTWSHYGVGSAGGGAWRELAALRMATEWVLDDACPLFPLLHHWRVLPGIGGRTPDSAEINRNVAYWHDDPGVRRRLTGLAASSTDLLLFLEYVPHRLLPWLRLRVRAGQGDAACALIERDLIAVTRFLGAHGMQHFDAHFGNLVTDGERLYLTDFGLAVSDRFDLAPEERDFLARHALHDGGHVRAGLVNWTVTALSDVGRTGWPHPRVRNDYVRRVAAGMAVPELPPTAARVIRRYAPVAVVVNDFYFRLHGESRRTPYPADELAAAIANETGRIDG